MSVAMPVAMPMAMLPAAPLRSVMPGPQPCTTVEPGSGALRYLPGCATTSPGTSTVVPHTSHGGGSGLWVVLLAVALALVLFGALVRFRGRGARVVAAGSYPGFAVPSGMPAPRVVGPPPGSGVVTGGRVVTDTGVGTGGGVVTADHLVHHGIADDYRRMVEQQVRDLALRLGAARGARAAAQRVAALCGVLFTDAGPDEAGLERLLGGGQSPDVLDRATRTFEAARALHVRILATRHRFTWDARVTSPVLVAGRQAPWGACDGADPVAFVVAPAYVVEGRVYGPQLVYTQPS